MRKWEIARKVSYIVLIIYALISLTPFIWAFLVSVAPMNYILNGKPTGVNIMQWPPEINIFKIPPEVFGAPATLSNYGQVFTVTPYARWILNTIIYAGFVTLGNLILDAMAGYAFAKLKFPGRNYIFTLLLGTLMVPFPVTIIPVYNLLVNFNLVNTYVGLIFPKVASVTGLFLMRQFYMSIPDELDEAAKVDGAGIFRRFWQIDSPVALPAFATLAIYTFMGTWNDFFWPLIVTSNKDMFTLAMGLNYFRTSYYTFWQLMMAASLLMTVPMIIIFLSFQRYFVETSTSSAVKG
ncbi:carbohydrate ABC transporter permease [Athalassotoga saccharophila]|uniref:carbohydrate ABC transporter permease n=1 Tax=Athalassotoga saccharophila TaxID=1441386 RepID=UPI00137B69CB|nr:carbohydrate ABC transporter permease [Athalassotoga saccharophila]BBJ28815.1 L-arabinose transport system permease protein AraQ [Athalassotoga saccharophila]